MTEFVRVRLENGMHASIPTAAAEAAKITPLKQPALRRDGRPAAPKHRTDKSGAAVATTNTPNTEATDASESKED